MEGVDWEVDFSELGECNRAKPAASARRLMLILGVSSRDAKDFAGETYSHAAFRGMKRRPVMQDLGEGMFRIVADNTSRRFGEPESGNWF